MIRAFLYVYPHPTDAARFIYVGQERKEGKRDKDHRSGKTSFGRRFLRDFPGIELPQPIRREVVASDFVSINEEETIDMFRFHTWRGYPGGMNLIFPGSLDYKNMGKIGGSNVSYENHVKAGKVGGRIVSLIPGHIARMSRKAGAWAVRSGQLASIRTPEHQRKAASIAGRIAVETGQIAALGREGSREDKARGGRTSIQLTNKLLGSEGMLNRARKGGRIGGRIAFEKGVGVFAPKHLGKGGRIGGPRGCHTRWHVNRGISNPNCKLCQQSMQIAA